MFTYTGDGSATFLQSSNEQIKVTWVCGTSNVTGAATLTSTQAPGDSVTATVSSTDFQSPCDGFTMSFAVTGGTGKFQHASGSGTIVLHALSKNCYSYLYKDKWKGKLKF